MAYPATLQIDYATPYETTTVQQYPIGQKAEDTSGSVFRYTLMGGVVGIANSLYQTAAVTANWVTQTHTVAIAAGDTSISFNDGGTAFTVNQAAGGTVIFEETADLGQLVRIKSNVVTASNETIMQLEDGVTVETAMAVASGNVLTFMLNPWSAVLIHPTTTPTGLMTGIPRVIIAASAYGWLQTRGVSSCIVVGTPVVGNICIPAGTTAGSVGEAATQTTTVTQIPGTIIEAGPSGDFGHIFLQIE